MEMYGKTKSSINELLTNAQLKEQALKREAGGRRQQRWGLDQSSLHQGAAEAVDNSHGHRGKPGQGSSQLASATSRQRSGDIKCYFCGKFGHMKKECRKYKAWQEKQEKKKQVPDNALAVQIKHALVTQVVDTNGGGRRQAMQRTVMRQSSESSRRR